MTVDETSAPIIDESALNVLKDEVGAETMAMLIDAFIDEIKNQQDLIMQAYHGGDYQTIETRAHALKSAAYSFGASALGAVCKQLEYTLRDGQFSGTEQLLEQLQTEAITARAQLSCIELDD